RLGFRRVPEDSVHTGSLRTRITDDSQNGQSPATIRVREQINQSLDFIPSALRDGLHDTRLEPTDRAPDLFPFDGMPVGRTLGSRTSEHFCCRHICLSPFVGWPRFSRDGTPEGSQPAFAARGCCPWENSPSIRSIVERRWLPPSSSTRRPIGHALRRTYPGGRTSSRVLPSSARSSHRSPRTRFESCAANCSRTGRTPLHLRLTPGEGSSESLFHPLGG